MYFSLTLEDQVDQKKCAVATTLGLVLLVLWSYSSLKEAMMYTCIDVDRVVGFALVEHGGRDLTGGGRQ